MSVPHEVRDAALAAFNARRPGVGVLDLVHDSLLDPPLDDWQPSEGAQRLLVFGLGEPTVRVEVAYTPMLTRLSVSVVPAESVEVEVLSVEPHLRLVVRGTPPLSLDTDSTGPASLGIVNTAENGTPQRWQTSWVTL